MTYAGFCQRGSRPFSEEPKGSENREYHPRKFFKSAASSRRNRRRKTDAPPPSEKNATRLLISRIILASIVNASSHRCRHMMTDMILLRKIHVYWTENLFLRLGFAMFGPANRGMWLTLIWLHHCHHCYFYSVGRLPAYFRCAVQWRRQTKGVGWVRTPCHEDA